jgi:hypothetical protein
MVVEPSRTGGIPLAARDAGAASEDGRLNVGRVAVGRGANHGSAASIAVVGCAAHSHPAVMYPEWRENVTTYPYVPDDNP